MPETRTAAGYIRVSSDEQAQHGISCDAQRQILSAWAVTKQLPGIEIYEDAGFSGKNTRRPALQRLLEDVRAGRVEHLVVWKLDRLSRNLRDTLAIIEDDLAPMGVTLISVTESIDTSTPSGRMMLNILASFAQLEREQDSDRVVMAHKHLARDCRYLGGHVPMGYRIDGEGHYQLDPPAAAAVRRVFEMYLDGSGYAGILGYLNGEAFPLSGKRRPWAKSDLNYLLNNEIYAGTYVRKMGADKRHRITAPETVRVPGGVPAILTAEEWQRVSRIREGNRAAMAKHHAAVVYPLRGMVFCAVCGRMMPLTHGGKDRSGAVERYYTCRAHCVRPVRFEQTEPAVYAALEAFAANPDALIGACEAVNTIAATCERERVAEAVPHEERILSLRKQLAGMTAYIRKNGASAPASLLDEIRRTEAEITAEQARIAALRKPLSRYDAARTLSAVNTAIAHKKSPPEQRHAALQQALFRVAVSDDAITIQLAWHTCGGDDPPQYVCHAEPRGRYLAGGPS